MDVAIKWVKCFVFVICFKTGKTTLHGVSTSATIQSHPVTNIPTTANITVETTMLYNYTTHNNTQENKQLDNRCAFYSLTGIATLFSALVVLAAMVATCVNRQNRVRKVYRTKTSIDNNSLTEKGSLPERSTIVLADIYSYPSNQTNNEASGNSNAATGKEKPDESEYGCQDEYHHLDFSIRSDAKPNFVGDNEYGIVRKNIVSVFEQPWDASKSTVNKLLS